VGKRLYRLPTRSWHNRWASKKTLAHPTKKGLAVSDKHFRFTNRPKKLSKNLSLIFQEFFCEVGFPSAFRPKTGLDTNFMV
jgi:hypothetical protein